MTFLKRLFVALSIGLWLGEAHSQTPLMQALAQEKWGVYILVSTKMPRDSLIAIARDAAMSDATLVLNGFPSKPGDVDAFQRFVADINQACCGTQKTKWEIHPQLFQKYQARETPTFILANTRNSTFVKVSGDMRLGQALKFIAQASNAVNARNTAREIYNKAFTGKE